MIRLEMKNYNTTLIEKQLKYQPYHLTYSPLGKAFEKQIKTIEDQEEKQIKTIQDKTIKTIKKYDYDDEDI